MRGKSAGYIFLAGIVLSGCVSTPPVREVASVRRGVNVIEIPRQAGTNVAEVVKLYAQYRPSVIPGADHTTCEIYLENLTTNALRLKSIYLDGVVVPAVLPGNAAARAKLDVCWWQFYPSAQVESLGAAMVQVNFQHSPKTARSLEVETGDGKRFTCVIPARDYRRAQLTAITYELDGSKIYVKYEGISSPPKRIFLDRRPVGFKTLLPGESADYGVLAATAPLRLTTGLPLHVKVEFQDGTRCDALVRVMLGIVKDVYYSRNVALRTDTASDALSSLPIRNDASDVTCTDLKKGAGYSIASEIGDRKKAFDADPNHLTALNFCTGMFTELWDIYGPMVDVCHITPYSFGHGPDQTHFIDIERKLVERAVKAVRPRPAIWVGEGFKRKDRMVEPGEMEQLVWMALGEGCKGVSYYVGMPQRHELSLLSNPRLQDEVARLNGIIREHEVVLSPMIDMGPLNVSDASVQSAVCWIGTNSMLVVLRNTDFTTAPDAGSSAGSIDRANAEIACHFKLPSWMPRNLFATDLVTGESVRFNVDRYGRLVLLADKFNNVKVIWIRGSSRKERAGEV